MGKNRYCGYLLVLNLILYIPCYSQVTFTSSNLPIIIIDTKGHTIVDEPKVSATMGIIDNGPGQINNLTDLYNAYNGNIGIELRGSSSQYVYDKKSFGIETWNANLEDTSVSILGMPAEEDWVLHGPYGDKSLIRNMLAFKLGRDLGRYASRTRLCELVLNGQYWGVYVFMEKVKRDNDRIDISKLNPDEISGDDLTGGYIFKIDKFDGGNSGLGWQSPYLPPNASNSDQVIYFQYEYPRNDEIVPEQMNYIKDYVTAFEDALKTKPLNDEITGYKSFVDVNSFIDYAVISEITRNVDAYRLSTFLYKDKDSKGGKLFMGPIWDYNLGFGNADYCKGGNTEGWAWDFNSVCNEDYWLIPFWWKRFLSDENFTTRLRERWTELRNGPYQTITIMQYIDSLSVILNEPSQRNFQRWNILGTYIWPNNFIGNTYDEEINYLKDWVRQRLEWLDANIPGLVTGIENNRFTNQNIEFFPNPFDESVTIEADHAQSGPLTLEIYNSNGSLINNLSGISTDNMSRIQWDGRDKDRNTVSPGLYLIIVKANGKRLGTSKLIKR